jgi:type II secretion system protein H
MTLTHRHQTSRAIPGAPPRAFTLVELLMVLALLTVVLGIAAPTLGNFFRARSLDSEAQRLLGLTRAGQSRAVSEGLPMILWLDAQRRRYGLVAEPSYEVQDPRAVEFELSKDVDMAVSNLTTRTNVNAGVNPITGRSVARPLVNLPNERGNLPQIRFLPDGSIGDTSPQSVQLADQDGRKVSLAQSVNRMNYELQTPLTKATAR